MKTTSDEDLGLLIEMFRIQGDEVCMRLLEELRALRAARATQEVAPVAALVDATQPADMRIDRIERGLERITSQIRESIDAIAALRFDFEVRTRRPTPHPIGVEAIAPVAIGPGLGCFLSDARVLELLAAARAGGQVVLHEGEAFYAIREIALARGLR